MIAKTTSHLILVIAGLSVLLPVMAQDLKFGGNVPRDCPTVKIEPERLTDLNIPRFGHSIVNINGEITVTGGHTTGFIPTPTAEYYSNSQWHLVNTTYTHDAGLSLPMMSGKVLLAGGFEKNLGIGQSYEVETYNPLTHKIEDFGCMERKRTIFSGLELDSGRMLITGNWYHDDGIELFDGNDRFTYIKDVAQQRANPFIFRIAPSDAIIVGSWDPWGNKHDSIVIDRLKGEPFTLPFFEKWKPSYVHIPFQNAASFIGNEDRNNYAYLFPVKNKDGQVAIAKVEGMNILLLTTTCEVPTKFGKKPIIYYSSILADRKSGCAYLLGSDGLEYGRQGQIYILRIDYGKATKEGAAPLTLYYTDPIPEMAVSSPTLTSDGDLMLIGGKSVINPSDNFHPSSSVLLFRFGNQITSEGNAPHYWLWLMILGGVILLSVVAYAVWRKRPRVASSNNQDEIQPKAIPSEQDAPNDDNKQLMQRISELIEDNKLFLNKDLKITDIAAEFGIHRNVISACINSQLGCAFTQFINGYRIEYAKQLMRQHPDMKLNHIGLESGFANETSFFRTFKAFTNMTPNEWKSKID